MSLLWHFEGILPFKTFAPITSQSQGVRHLGQWLIICRKLIINKLNMKWWTGCCSTDSKRPHHFCHLPNKLDILTTHLIFPILMSPKITPSTGGFTLQSNVCFLGPTQSKWHLDWFIRFVTARGYYQQTDIHTDHSASVAVGHILCFV